MKNHSTAQNVTSRRGFLKLASTPKIIASLMVQARPEHFVTVIPALDAMQGVEVHASGETGRMVVTLEAIDDQQFMDMVSAIQNQKHIINAQLVYHQIEDL